MGDKDVVKDAVVLPLRVVPQPVPFLYSGGDCGACVLAGLLGMEVREVYDRFQEGKIEPFDYYSMPAALRAARHQDLDRMIEDVPIWPHEQPLLQMNWGLGSGDQRQAWGNYVRMALDAGYYGVAMVNFQHAGPPADMNHWVLLCGIREKWVSRGESGAYMISPEVLVSCSSTRTPAEEWVPIKDFLEKWGGFSVLLVRPTRKG